MLADDDRYFEMLCAKALTAEVTMEAAKTEEQKKDILRLRGEVNDWKNKFYDCKRKLTQYQYVWSSLAGCYSAWGYRGGSPTAVQAWQPCPLWELSPSHPILL